MPRTKKTIQILPLVQWSNDQLKRTDEYATADFKSGICVTIERILLDSGTYQGYYHLDSNDCAHGTLGYFSRRYFTTAKYAVKFQDLSRAAH